MEECARKKAEAVYQELSKGSQSMPEHMKTMQELTHTIIVSCDTVVVNNGNIIGKPKDKEDAKFDFVENIEGSMDNVVGFPIEIFKEMLKKIY